MKNLSYQIGVCGLCLMLGAPVLAQESQSDSGAKVSPEMTRAIALFNASNTGLRISDDATWVELLGEVVNREAEVLEALICHPSSGRVHETILYSEVEPSMLHAALLMIGLKNGSPQRYVVTERNAQGLAVKGEVIACSGEELSIYVHQGEELVGINQWLLEVTDDAAESVQSNDFVFAGSYFDKGADGHPRYMADVEGNQVSMVNFGTDLLVPAGQSATDAAESQSVFYAPNTDVLPPDGTQVWVRFVPLSK